MSAPKPGGGVRVSGNTAEFTSRTAIAQTIVQLEAIGEGFRAPLFRAAAAGRLAVATAIGGTPVPARFLKLSRPTVIVLADDHPGATGPDAWPQAKKLLRWAHSAVFHAASGDPAHYAMISAATVQCGRMLLVELEFRHMQAWMRLAARELPRLNLLQIVPREGEHPIRSAPAGAVLQ